MNASGGGASPPPTVPSAELPLRPLTRWRKVGLWLTLGAHSKAGVWVVIGALVISLTGVTAGFLYFGWPLRYVPLYEADAEVAIVASALYVIVVQWPREDRKRA